MLSQVYRSAQRAFECKVLAQNEYYHQIITATALGNLLKEGEIVVGDKVEVIADPSGDGGWTITEIHPRKSEVFRFLLRESKKKVVAANCDLLAIVMSVSRPTYKRGLVDRYLVRSYQWGIPAIVIFNKMDEYRVDKQKQQEDLWDIQVEEKRLEHLSIPCFEICALDSQYKPRFLQRGWQELEQYLHGKMLLMQGQSGVGKSKIISSFISGERELLSRELGRFGKGTHTTTWSEIIEGEFCSLIDTPGIRSFALDDIAKEELMNYFPDLSEIAVSCEFSKCHHQPNAQGCAFYQEGVSPLIKTRLDSYLQIMDEISDEHHYKKRR